MPERRKNGTQNTRKIQPIFSVNRLTLSIVRSGFIINGTKIYLNINIESIGQIVTPNKIQRSDF